MELDNFMYEDQNNEEFARFRNKGNLTMRKLAEYIPVMIITNLSLLFINSVDSILAGNIVGAEAMKSISIFHPIFLLTSVFSCPVASGIATSISNAMGKGDLDEVSHIKGIGVRLMILSAVLAGVIQIPIVYSIISSYGVSESLSVMVRQYAIGCMICTPLSIISTVGTYQLQIAGKMKVTMLMTLIEGILNLLFDLLFMAVFHMGVVGAGLGTACSNLTRCILTVVYISKYTDFYKGDGRHVTAKELWDVLACGIPDASFMLIMSIQNYFMLRIIISEFGEDGGIIYGLSTFCLSIINVFLVGIQGGMRPLMGLYTGAGDKQGMRNLMRHGLLTVIFYAGAVIAAIMFFPEFFYYLHGIREVPEWGDMSIKLLAVSFIIRGFNYVLRLYLTNRKDVTFATVLTFLGNAMLPIFAIILSLADVPSPALFLSYLCTELLVFILSLGRYFYFRAIDSRKEQNSLVLYMTVRKDEAAEASEQVKSFADEHGINNRVSYRTALCIEEMVAYTQRVDLFSLYSTDEIAAAVRDSELTFLIPPGLDAEKTIEHIQKTGIFDIIQQSANTEEIIDRVKQLDLASMLPPGMTEEEFIEILQNSYLFDLIGAFDPAVDIIVRFNSSDKVSLITLDDGKCIALDNSEEKKNLITDNYNMIRKIAESVEYQYILNMNYTKITIA